MDKYMHTIAGKPASFTGEQITYAGSRYNHIKLLDSLKEIKKEQRLSMKFREEFFGEKNSYLEYGYCIVEVEEDD